MTIATETLWGVTRGLPGCLPDDSTILLGFEVAVGHLRDLIDDEESSSDGTHGTEFEKINHSLDEADDATEAWGWTVPGSAAVWTLFQIDDPDEATERAAALCESLGDSVVSDAVDDWDGDVTFECGLHRYLVLTEDEAESMAETAASERFDEWVMECPQPWRDYLHTQGAWQSFLQELRAGDMWSLLGDYEQCRGYVVVR